MPHCFLNNEISLFLLFSLSRFFIVDKDFLSLGCSEI
jgi:hypothetical protein